MSISAPLQAGEGAAKAASEVKKKNRPAGGFSIISINVSNQHRTLVMVVSTRNGHDDGILSDDGEQLLSACACE